MRRRPRKSRAVLRGGRLSEADIPVEMDLLWAVANLVEMEEHLWSVIGDVKREVGDDELAEEAIELMRGVRNLRAKLMKKLVPARHFETWCELKHAISALYRIGEVASKFASECRDAEAAEMAACQKEALNLYVRSLILSAKIERALGGTDG